MSGNKNAVSFQGEGNACLLRGEDVAHILNVSRAFAFRLIRRGEIPAVHLGRSVRVRREDLEAFIAASVEGKV